MVFQRPTPKKTVFEKNVILPARDACKFCRIILLGATGEMQKGLRVDFFAVCPAGLKRVLREFSGNPQICAFRR